MKNGITAPYYFQPKLISSGNLGKDNVTVLTCIGYFLACLGTIILLLQENLTAIFAASILIMVAVLLIVFELSNRSDWRDYLLLLAYSAFFILVYPVSGMLIPFFPDSVENMLPTYPSVWRLSLLVGTMGWISLSSGFLIFMAMTARSRNQRILRNQNITWEYWWGALLCISILGLIFRLMVALTFFSEEFFDFYSRAGTIPSTLGDLGLMATFVLMLSSNKVWSKVDWAIFAGYCMGGLFTGQRAEAIIPLLMAGIFMLLYRWNLSWKFYTGLIAFFLILIVSSPMMERYKSSLGDARIRSAGMERAVIVRQALDDISHDRDATEVDEEGGLFINFLHVSRRYSHLQFGGQLVSNYLDFYGYMYGKSCLMGFIALVPRAIWQDKPNIGLGEIAYQMMGYEGPGAATVPVAADWYINFGWFGVFGGMFLLGLLYALLNNILWRKDMFCGALLAFMTYHLMIAGMGISNILAVTFIEGLGVLVLRKLTVSRS